MNISERTLSRYLEADKSSFRALSPEVRIERARTLLRTGELSVTEIAYRLGYRDVARFVRAFRARTGSTPGAYRA